MKKSTEHTAGTSNTPEPEILRVARQHPELGQAGIAARLQQAGLKISPSGVRYILKKHGLETAAKRLEALADSGEHDPLSDNQQKLLDRTLLTRDLQEKKANRGESDVGRRSILLNAAAELFAEKGFDRTSMRDIASRAGLLPGSVYHHFNSKSELFLSIHKEGFNRVMQRIKEAADQGVDPWDSLARALGAHIESMVDDSQPVQKLGGQSLAMIDLPELREQLQPFRHAYENIIRQLIEDLPLRANSDRTLLRLTLLGASNWVFLWYREGKRTPQDIAQNMVAMLRSGVGPLDE